MAKLLELTLGINSLPTLAGIYEYEQGNSASGIDLPGLGVDIKVTSIKQPQSSCPFKSASQKIFGLDYHLLVFVYESNDLQWRLQYGRVIQKAGTVSGISKVR